MKRKKHIELIDKYRIEQSKGGGYNPPSYIWEDNTGETIRCKDCANWNGGAVSCECPWEVPLLGDSTEYDFCSRGIRK